MWVGFLEEPHNGTENHCDGQRGTPIGLERVKTHLSIGIDIAVVDASAECDGRRREGVVTGKVDRQKEDAFGLFDTEKIKVMYDAESRHEFRKWR